MHHARRRNTKHLLGLMLVQYRAEAEIFLGGDHLWGGTSDDTMTGGGGADTFMFWEGHGNDRITDFNIADDKIDLTWFDNAIIWSDLQAAMRDENGSTVIDLSQWGGGTVTLEGVTISELTAEMFDLPDGSGGRYRYGSESDNTIEGILNLESRYVEVKCPFDLRLAFARDKGGKPALRNLLGASSPVRARKLAALLHVTDEREWRYPDRPTIQLSLPYVFVADEPVYMAQVAPFMHYRADPWPGTIFGGRYPIDVWPRPLMWAFEWHDVDRELKLSRGEPLFYCQFETVPQDRPIQLVEAERTPELEEYLGHISGAVNFVNRSFSLFRTAQERRPKTLVVRKSR